MSGNPQMVIALVVAEEIDDVRVLGGFHRNAFFN